MLENAKGEFSKTLQLDGVEGYKEYAKLRIQSIENALKFPEVAAGTLDALKAIVGEIEAGALSGREAIGKKVDQVMLEWQQKDADLSRKAAELVDQAELLRQEKGI